MNREELRAFGLEDESVITKILDKYHEEVNPLKETNKTLKEQVEQHETVLESLKETSEKDLQAKIAEITTQYDETVNNLNQKLQDADFNRVLSGVLSSLKAKRQSAVKAELDLDTLKQSKNQEADIKAAVEALKNADETAFLFDSEETGAKVSYPGSTSGNPDTADLAKARAVMGLSSIEHGKEK